MIYGEKKTRLMARDGLVRRADWRGRSREQEKEELRRYLDGDEDADVNIDTGKIAMGWDNYAYRPSSFRRWAVASCKGETPEARLAEFLSRMPTDADRYWADRAVGYNDPFELDIQPSRYTVLTPEEKAQERTRRHEKRMATLRAVGGNSEATALLNAALRASHSTVYWTVWKKGVPTLVPDGISKKQKWVPRDQFVSEQRGPTAPRLLKGGKDVDAFWKDICAAADVPHQIESGERIVNRQVRTCRFWYRPLPRDSTAPTYITESVETKQRNPDYHPEWLRAVLEFLDAWVPGK